MRFFPFSKYICPKRSVLDRVVFNISNPALTLPEYTRKKDKSPTCASLIVLNTFTTGSSPSRLTDTSSSDFNDFATTVPLSTGDDPYLETNSMNLVTPTLILAEVQNNGVKL